MAGHKKAALTLPIEIGKKYVRRDGVVITASNEKCDECLVFVGVTDIEKFHGIAHAYLDTGLIFQGGREHNNDLVADYIEPATEVKTGHKHAALMAEYAQDAAETAEPWRLWQRSDACGGWRELDTNPMWSRFHEYRRKPRTITINGREIEAPLREAPQLHQAYFVLQHLIPIGVVNWSGHEWERDALKAGRLFATKEAAQAAYDAITSLLVPKE